MDWKQRKSKVPGVIGGYSFDTDDRTELWVKEVDGRWTWSFEMFSHGYADTKERAQQRAIEMHAKVKLFFEQETA